MFNEANWVGLLRSQLEPCAWDDQIQDIPAPWHHTEPGVWKKWIKPRAVRRLSLWLKAITYEIADLVRNYDHSPLEQSTENKDKHSTSTLNRKMKPTQRETTGSQQLTV